MEFLEHALIDSLKVFIAVLVFHIVFSHVHTIILSHCDLLLQNQDKLTLPITVFPQKISLAIRRPYKIIF